MYHNIFQNYEKFMAHYRSENISNINLTSNSDFVAILNTKAKNVKTIHTTLPGREPDMI
jgi:hypothetical protein